MAAGLSISLIGPPVVTVDGVPLAVDTRKATALLAYLAVSGAPARRDTIVGLLWPETDPDRARATLRRTLSTLRSALDGRWLVTEGDTVRLETEGTWLDVLELTRLLAECTTHGHGPSETCPRCLEPLEAAVALERGGFLAGFGLRDSAEFDDWERTTGVELQRELASALERLADLLARRGEISRAVTHAERRLAADPLNESAHRQLIRLYAASGDRAEAVEQYRECVRLLDRELGVRPLDETTELYRAVLEGDVALASPETAPHVSPRQDAGYPLTGRERELESLLDAYRAVGPGGRLVVLAGEAGIGKTRLGDELLTCVRREEGLAIGVRCFREEAGLAYGVAVEIVRAALPEVSGPIERPWWLAEIGRLVPEVGEAPPAEIDSVAMQARFYEAVCALLSTAAGDAGKTALFVDDMHWADDSSLGLLGYLVHRLESRPILVVASWRPEEVPASHPVRRLLAEAQRNRDADVVSPRRLTRADVRSLASAAGHDDSLAERLFAESGGLPLFVVEYLDALERLENEDDAWPLPLGVRDLVESRLASLGELATQTLAAAAILGHSVDPPTLRDTSGRTDDESVGALDELVAAGLLVESTEGSYDFRHDQARQLVVEQMTIARRRLLHRRAGAALESSGRREVLAAVIASHLEQAGEDAQAAELYGLAGDRERGLYANAEALAHYRSAIALGHPESASLHVACGDLETLAGDYAAAFASYDTAQALAPDDRRGEIEHRRGLLHLRRGEWELADAAFGRALDDTPETPAPLLADRSLAAHRLGDDERAFELAQQALDAAKSADDAAALAQSLNVAGVLAKSRGDARSAVELLEESLALARDSGDEAAVIAARNNLALALASAGERDAALELAYDALEVCVRLGDRHREAAIRNTLADLLHGASRDEESMEELKRAVAIFAEVGAPGELEPEIWKLSEW